MSDPFDMLALVESVLTQGLLGQTCSITVLESFL